MLEAPTRAEALRLLHGYMLHEVQVLELRHKIASQAQTEMTKEQRDYFLRQQLRAIQEELGEKDPEKAEIAWELAEAIDGIAAAATAIGAPVVSGNVSLYNETDGRAIPPTPVVG